VDDTGDGHGEEENVDFCVKACHVTCYVAAYTSQTRAQKRFTISEVAADWHELMIPQRIMQPSTARASKQLYPRCSQRTYHRPNQSHSH